MRRLTKKNRKYYRVCKKDESIGFIVTRCVKKPEHNILYKECYTAIRRFHPDLKIVVIDDNSDKNILEEIPMTNVEIIQSDFPAAGEFLPYYYLLTRKLFIKAIIIQDSMILNTRVPYETVGDYMFLYYADYDKNAIDPYYFNLFKHLLESTKIPAELMKCYDNNINPPVCYGTCSVITYNFLQGLEDKVGIMQWKTIINNRDYRQVLEAAMGLICHYLKNKNPNSLFGYFHDLPLVKEYGNNNYRLSNYINDKSKIQDGTIKGTIIKIWNTR